MSNATHPDPLACCRESFAADFARAAHLSHNVEQIRFWLKPARRPMDQKAIAKSAWAAASYARLSAHIAAGGAA